MDRKPSIALWFGGYLLRSLGPLGLFCLLIAVLFLKTDELGSFPFSFFAGCLGVSIALIRRLPKADDSTIEDIVVRMGINADATALWWVYGGRHVYPLCVWDPHRRLWRRPIHQ